MIRRLGLFGVLFVAGPMVACASAAPERPNVIFIMTNDQGFGDLGCHGNPVLTPYFTHIRRDVQQ